jgi:uncharacterized membrane protein
MVTAVGDPAGHGGRLILMPHAPKARERAVLMFSVIASIVLTVAIVCSLLGAWQVAPISLLVVVATGIGVRAGYLRTQVREVVSIDGDTVAVERIVRRRRERHEFQRGWAQVVLEPLPLQDLSLLFIRSHGRQVELGAFLEDDERQELAERLRRLMGPGRTFAACAEG